ncbi:DMP19 family protein [Algivirga pacifica]|uniref:DNA mimic protein DMP19 C-terminal domain-containing protein n=1 Tax=Algivirga pacifica TaxID=1162670 RepID=A0ABP9DGB5_9BACT
MTREEAQAAWEKIVELGFSDYNQLSREERVWFNIEPLTIDGLWDHYINHGADKNSDTIEDLEYLGFHSIAEQLQEFNKKFFPKGVPQDRDERQEQLDAFSEDELENYIDVMDDKFWDLSDDLDNVLLKHINNTGIGN